MSTTNHFISVKTPSVGAFQLGSGGASANSNIHTGTSSTAADLVEVRWVADTVLMNSVSRLDFLRALETIARFVMKGGFGPLNTSQDANIPV